MPGLVVLEGKLNLVNWTDGAMNPTLAVMKAEIKIRNSNSRSQHYQTNKCVEMVRNLPYVGEDLSNLFNDAESVVKRAKHSKIRDAPKIVNAILELQEECLLHENP